MANVVRAKSSFATSLNGRTRIVRRGQTFDAKHPLVKGREHMFVPFEADATVEAATAAPGEKRLTQFFSRDKNPVPETVASQEDDQ